MSKGKKKMEIYGQPIEYLGFGLLPDRLHKLGLK
jgi:hypothetical protein